MSKCEATMNFRFLLILWREKVVKVFLRIDPNGARIAEDLGPLVKVHLNIFENGRQAVDDFGGALK